MATSALTRKNTTHTIPSASPDYVLNCVVHDAPDAGPVGAIVWGLGVAEVRTARRLAAKGIPSMQVRIQHELFVDAQRRTAVYSTDGILNCRAAMNAFSAQRGVESFILMGNCAGGTFCFNAALADERVTGLILTNPHVSKQELLRVSLLHKLLQPGTWKRLARGGVRVRDNIGELGALFGTAARGSLSRTLDPRPAKSDLELPKDFAGALRSLIDRGVQVLIACAAADDSAHYLRAKHRPVIAELEARGGLKFEVVAADTHVFSTDDAAAALLNESISRWIETTSFNAASSVPRGLRTESARLRDHR